jgi:hypothetical protein
LPSAHSEKLRYNRLRKGTDAEETIIMTFLMTLMTRLHGRLAEARAHGDSGQDLIEYAMVMAGFTILGAAVYLVVSH